MKKIVLAALFMSGVGLSGCQQIQSQVQNGIQTVQTGVKKFDQWSTKQNAQIWDEFQNKSIRDKFIRLDVQDGIYRLLPVSTLEADKFNVEKRRNNSIHLEKYVFHEANFAEADRKIRQNKYISEKDLAAKMFVEQALAQGHEVRVYKAALGGEINRRVDQPINEHNGSSNVYNQDPVFVEFDKMGAPVAFMTRSWQTLSGIGVDSRIYTNIYFGDQLTRWFENSFGNEYLKDLHIRTIK